MYLKFSVFKKPTIMRELVIFIIVGFTSMNCTGQLSIYTSMNGSVLCNFANQYIEYQNQKLSYNINGAYGIRIGAEYKKFSFESGLIKVHNADRIILVGRATKPVGFKLPEIKVFNQYVEVPFYFLYNIKNEDSKISIQPMLGFTYVYNSGNNRGLNTPDDNGTIPFKYGNEPWALDFHYKDIRFEYSSYSVNTGVRINYPLSKHISTTASILMRMGLRPISNAAIRYLYYRSDILPKSGYSNEVFIVNNGNSIGVELSLKYHIYSKGKVPSNRKM